MSRIALVLLFVTGLVMLAGGIFTYVFGLVARSVVEGRGPFAGAWHPIDFCWAGALLGTLGTGLTAFAGIRTFFQLRHGTEASPRRRTFIWAVTLATFFGGLTATAGLVWASQGPEISLLTEENDAGPDPEEEKAIRAVIIAFGNSNLEPLTEDFRRRLRGQSELVSYLGKATAWIYRFGPDHAIAVGYVRATHTQIQRVNVTGRDLVLRQVQLKPLPEPKRIELIYRFVKTKEGRWLIHDVEYADQSKP